jgi:hypothetical protein
MTVLKNRINTLFKSHWGSLSMLRIKRNVIQVIIAVAFAAAAVGAVVLWKGMPERGTRVTPEQAAMTKSATNGRTFRQISIFDGRIDDGTRFSEQHYKSSDCSPISSRVIFFRSPGRALYEVQLETQRAAEVLNRGPILDDKSQRIGERVVMQFAAEGRSETYTKIVSNKGSDFLSLTAPSLEDALAFEKSAKSSNNSRVFPGIESVKAVTFESTGTSEGSEKGVRYKEEQFRSSDCETLVTRTEYFESTKTAQDRLQKQLKDSTGVLEQGPKLNSVGQPVGERAVASFKAGPTSEHLETTVVMWTDGDVFHSITGLYIYVLEFEKRKYQ